MTKLPTFDLSSFLDKIFLDSFQAMFGHQPTFSMLKLKEEKGTKYTQNLHFVDVLLKDLSGLNYKRNL